MTWSRRRSVWSGLLLVSLWQLAAIAPARELAVPRHHLVEAELVAVVPSPDLSVAAALLRVKGSREWVPIFIGLPEAEAIERARSGERPPRPLTHELFGDVLAGAGIKIERLVIDALRDDSYLAVLELRLRDGRSRRIDTRPSDGMALALRQGAPILIAREVVEAAQKTPPDAQPTLTTRHDVRPRASMPMSMPMIVGWVGSTSPAF